MAFSAIGAVLAGTATTATVIAAVGEVGLALSVVGAVTGNKSLLKVGGVLGLASGIGSIANASFGAATEGAAAGAAVSDGDVIANGVSDAAANSGDAAYASMGYDASTKAAAQGLTDSAANSGLDAAANGGLDAASAANTADVAAPVADTTNAADSAANAADAADQATAYSVNNPYADALTQTDAVPTPVDISASNAQTPLSPDAQSPSSTTTGNTDLPTMKYGSNSIDPGSPSASTLQQAPTTPNGGLDQSWTSKLMNYLGTDKGTDTALKVGSSALSGIGKAYEANRQYQQNQELVDLKKQQAANMNDQVRVAGIINKARSA